MQFLKDFGSFSKLKLTSQVLPCFENFISALWMAALLLGLYLCPPQVPLSTEARRWHHICWIWSYIGGVSHQRDARLQPQSSERAVSTLSHWGIFPAPHPIFIAYVNSFVPLIQTLDLARIMDPGPHSVTHILEIPMFSVTGENLKN